MKAEKPHGHQRAGVILQSDSRISILLHEGHGKPSSRHKMRATADRNPVLGSIPKIIIIITTVSIIIIIVIAIIIREFVFRLLLFFSISGENLPFRLLHD